MAQSNSSQVNYERNQEFSYEMQPIAIDKYYKKVWPGVRVFEIDIDTKTELSKMIDVGGADKMLRFGNRNVAFLAQRFRQSIYIKYDEFTIRLTEYNKALMAIGEDRFISSFYSYGFANGTKTDFLKFYILKYRDLIIHLKNISLPLKTNPDGTKFYYIKFIELPEDLFLFKWNIQGSLP